jgi:vacuolar-type H+-ATPase subunit H
MKLKMVLKTIQQIALGLFCLGVIAFSNGFLFTLSAIALPESTPLAAVEEMTEDAINEVQESTEEAGKAVEEGVENATEKAEEVKETVEEKTQEGIEKTKEAADEAASKAEENGENIIDRIKGLFNAE